MNFLAMGFWCLSFYFVFGILPESHLFEISVKGSCVTRIDSIAIIGDNKVNFLVQTVGVESDVATLLCETIGIV